MRYTEFMIKSPRLAEGSFNKCFDKACKLYDRAVEKNLNPVLYQVSDYKGDGSDADSRWAKLPQHVWSHYVTVVGDTVYDPTAKQFGPDKSEKYNINQLEKEWGNIYKIRPEQQAMAEGKEKFNYELTKKGFHFEQEINEVTYKVFNKKGGSDNIIIEAVAPDGAVIGFARFWMHQYKDGLESLSTQVADEWQGKGIATNMYAVMRMLGVNIHPATMQSDQGKAMWNKWRKQGDAQHITSMNAKMAENFADGKNPGRKGLAKRSGVDTKASVSTLRRVAKHSSGEKQRMAHWLANMKAGRAKKK